MTRRQRYISTSTVAISAGDAPLMLGGQGVVVQIDESLFGHHRGRAPRNEVWVFGMCDISQSPALGVMSIVPNWTHTTLLPILQRPGTIVHSDQWRA